MEVHDDPPGSSLLYESGSGVFMLSDALGRPYVSPNAPDPFRRLKRIGYSDQVGCESAVPGSQDPDRTF